MSNAADAYRKAGFPLSHGLAVQEVADQTDRIIVSRCAQEIGIQLLEENYSSKGFGIKAKSCDWGPFAGFAMGHFQYSKFEKGVERFEKQIKFFKDSGHTGFHNDKVHVELAQPDAIRVTSKRLERLAALGMIRIYGGLMDGAVVCASGPFGPVQFLLKNLPGSEACWGFLHDAAPPAPLKDLARLNQKTDGKQTPGVDPESSWGKLTFVQGMTNTLPEDRNLSDPAKNCVAGDYDLWGVFPRKGSTMAKHGMDRQARIFAGVNPNAGKHIKDVVGQLQKDTLSKATERTYKMPVGGKMQEFKYTEDPEWGNVSACVRDTAHKINAAIKAKGYRGGRMVHHNDDMGNPFRTDVEKQLIAFIPKDRAYFIGDGSYYAFIRSYADRYELYDNPAIWGKR